MTHDSHVFCGMVFADTAVIFFERHIQTPVQRVLYSPMSANGTGKDFDICKRSDEVSVWTAIIKRDTHEAKMV